MKTYYLAYFNELNADMSGYLPVHILGLFANIYDAKEAIEIFKEDNNYSTSGVIEEIAISKIVDGLLEVANE